jgi:selenide,water dikinase
LAEAGFVPGGTKNNFAYLQDSITYPETMDQIDQWILCDAVTSGGLLISIANDQADLLLADLLKVNVDASIIGEIIATHPGHIEVI